MRRVATEQTEYAAHRMATSAVVFAAIQEVAASKTQILYKSS
uniref:Uncharacterized protein n=1 Tax=viral metagenome TaxID=1070528 RepID=A0A6C0DBT5_9ZZZZ